VIEKIIIGTVSLWTGNDIIIGTWEITGENN